MLGTFNEIFSGVKSKLIFRRLSTFKNGETISRKHTLRRTYINMNGNLPPSCDSSETTRKASSFDFSDFYKYGQPENVPRISETFLEWFIGFFEGDGCLISRDTFDKRYATINKRFGVQIGQKEKNIVEIIQKTFGFGNISIWKRGDEVYWRWTVDSKTQWNELLFFCREISFFQNVKNVF